MKLGSPTDTQVEGSEDFTSHDFRISDANSAHIFRMLTNYSDPIGSVVREITTNCFDAHKKADVDRDVVINMSRGSKLDGVDSEIKFIDYGTGLTPEEVEEIFTVLGESTKRDNNEEMGAFGIGAKSPFGYIRENDLGGFTVDSYVDGTHWQYFLAESAEEGPQMTEILKEDTDRTNGVVVTVPIGNGDFYKFKRALRKQLAYFENIDFQVTGVSSDYTIYRGEHFIYRPDESPHNKIHACFGKVAYSLNYEILDWPTAYGARDKMKAPIGLLFDIGDGIKVTPNREAINYTQDVIDTIHDKMESAQEEFREMWENEYDDVSTIEGLLEARENRQDRNITVQGVDIPYSEKLLPDDSISLDFFEDITPPNKLYYNFKVHKAIDEDGYVQSGARLPSVSGVVQNGDGYYVEGSYSPKTNRYIASRYGDDKKRGWHLVKPESEKTDLRTKYIIDDPAEDNWDPDEADDPFNSRRSKPPLSKCDHPEKHKARYRFDKWWNNYQEDQDLEYDELDQKHIARILKFEEMVEEYVKENTKDYSYEPSEDFKEWEKKKREQKEKQKKKKREDQFPIKILEEDSSWDGDYKWKMDDMKYDALDNSTMYIYGFQENDQELLDIAPLIWSNDNWEKDRGYSGQPSRKKIAVLKIAMKREYLFEDLDNAMHISTFQDGHKIIDRAYHADWIQSQLQISPGGTVWKVMERYYPNLASKIREMNNFYKTYAKESLPDPEDIGVEVSNKRDFKYTREEIEIANEVINAVKEQLPLLDKLKFRGTTSKDLWDEFEIYVDAKNIVHPRLYMKKHNMID